jgi:HrpA-like RNA helicase
MKHEQGCITTEAERRIRAESLEEIAYLRKTDLPRRKLPISEQRPQIEQQLREHDVILVEAPPGAGKSLDLGVMALQVFPHARVAMTQPQSFLSQRSLSSLRRR